MFDDEDIVDEGSVGPPVLEMSERESAPMPRALPSEGVTGAPLLPAHELRRTLRGERPDLFPGTTPHPDSQHRRTFRSQQQETSSPASQTNPRLEAPAVTLTAADLDPQAAAARALADLEAARAAGINLPGGGLISQAVNEAAKRPAVVIDASKEVVDYAGPPTPERTLQVIEREINTSVRQWGELQEHSSRYRRSARGRKELRVIQRRIHDLLQEKITRGRRGGAIQKEIDTASQEVARGLADGSISRDQFARVDKALHVAEEERHMESERVWSSDSVPRLMARVSDLEREARERQDLLDSEYSGDLEPDDLATAADIIREIEIRQRQIKSAQYLHAQRVLSTSTALSPYRRLLDAENRYRQFTKEEGVLQTGEIETEIAFAPGMNFTRAREIYERESRSGGDEDLARAARREMEAVLREATRRGYFNAFTIFLNGQLEPAMAMARAYRQPFVLQDSRDMDTSSQIQRAFEVWSDPAYAANYIRRFVRLSQEEGLRSADDDPDIGAFDGAVQFWMERLGGYLNSLRQGTTPEGQWDGEYTLGRTGRGHGWKISMAGYIELEEDQLRTRAQIEEAMLSYVRHLTGGVINVEPGTIIGKADQFEQIFFEHVDRHFPDGVAAVYRRQFTAMVAFWGVRQYGLLGRSEHAAQMLEYAYSKADSIRLISDTMMAADGWVGLSVRFMDRKKKFKPINQYSGENGGFAMETSELGEGAQMMMGTGEFVVRDKTLLTLAEDIMVYDISDSAPTSVDLPRATIGDPGMKERNLKEIVHYQTSSEFMKKFKLNPEMVVIVKKVRGEVLTDEEVRQYGERLTQQELQRYKDRLRKAQQAVDFARAIQAATGVQAQKSAPSYIVEVYQRRRVEGGAGEVRVIDANTKKALPEHLTPDQVREQGYLERKDYLDAEQAIRFVQFSENMARIMVSAANARRVAQGRRPLTAWEMEDLADYYRELSAVELRTRGYGARLLDENGEELLFLPANAVTFTADNPDNVARFGRDFPGESLTERSQQSLGGFQDGVRIDLDSATSRAGIALTIAASMVTSGEITVGMIGGRVTPVGGVPYITKSEYEGLPAAVKLEIQKRVGAEIRDKGYRSLDFDEVISHTLSRNNEEGYLVTQQEIRAQLLSQETRDGALRIRKGISLPEEEDVLCTMLLQVDPTLRLRGVSGAAGDKLNRDLILAHVGRSKKSRWVIKRELDKIFLDPETGHQSVYIGYPNEPYSFKELEWSNMLYVRQRQYGRRGFHLFADAPYHLQSMPSTAGVDLAAYSGVMERGNWVQQSLTKEVTDSNVLLTWVEKFKKAHATLVRFAKGGTLGNEQVVAWTLKPFDNLEAGLQQHALLLGQSAAGVLTAYQKWRENCGRLEATLKAIESQDKTGGFAGWMDLSRTDIRYVENPVAKRAREERERREGRSIPPENFDGAQLLFYDRDSGELAKTQKISPTNAAERESWLRSIVNADGVSTITVSVRDKWIDEGQAFITIPIDGELRRVRVKREKRQQSHLDRLRGRVAEYDIFLEAPSWDDAEEPSVVMDTDLGVQSAKEFLSAAIVYAMDEAREQYKTSRHVIELMTQTLPAYTGFSSFWQYLEEKAIRTGVGGQAA